MKKHKICIVGGGLTGLISALVLSEKGLDIDLIVENTSSHPERINQDWKMIKKGDPLFIDSQGIIHKYDGDPLIWPVFIGEVAYKEKKIAMSYTKKEVVFTKKQWVQEFESL